MPVPLSAMVARASSSCWRQSQRSEWKTSPVRHWEWMRTMGGAAKMSPMTRAIADSTRRAGAGAASLQGSIRDDSLEAEDAELPPACGEVGIGELANGFEGH